MEIAYLLTPITTAAIIAIVVAVVAIAVLAGVSALLHVREKRAAQPQEQPAEELVAEKTHEEPVAEPVAEETHEEPVAEEPAAEETHEEPVAEEPAEQPAEEEAAIAAAPAAAQEEVPAQPSPEADGVLRVVVPRNRLVRAKYDKSFTARIIQAPEAVKGYYSVLKNELLSYRKVKARTTWKKEGFRLGRTGVAKFTMRGKTLCLYLALDTAAYEGTKYAVEDVSAKSQHGRTPCLYRIKNARRCNYAKALIADAAEKAGAVKGETPNENYVYPYEADEPLLARKLIKRIEEQGEHAAAAGEHVVINVAEVAEMMNDEEAEASVGYSDRFSDKTKTAVVNVDTLGEYFNDGERVTVADMCERIPYLSKKTTYVKVLARGSLNKSLEVEADDFSLDAVKMIVLAGGKVYRTQVN